MGTGCATVFLSHSAGHAYTMFNPIAITGCDSSICEVQEPERVFIIGVNHACASSTAAVDQAIKVRTGPDFPDAFVIYLLVSIGPLDPHRPVLKLPKPYTKHALAGAQARQCRGGAL